MSEEKNQMFHNVIMEQCKKLNMSGIKEVKTFDEETVILETDTGLLTVKGEELNIESFSVTTGELVAQGKIYALVYSDSAREKGMLRRLMK